MMKDKSQSGYAYEMTVEVLLLVVGLTASANGWLLLLGPPVIPVINIM